MAATLLVVSALVWLVMRLMPGDPADLAMMADPALTAADIERLRAAHGLDRPLHERYLSWLSAVLRGEFGFSRLYAVPAAQVLWPALRSTLVLLGASLALAAGVGTTLGVLAAARPRWAPAGDALAGPGPSGAGFW